MSAALSDDQFEDKFFLIGQKLILNTLNELIHTREATSVYFNGGSEFILTVLLSASVDGLVFEIGGNARANNLLETVTYCSFVALPSGIRVQLSGSTPTRFMWGYDDAFWVPISDKIVRLQRRENYRNKLPIAPALKTSLDETDDIAAPQWTSHDLNIYRIGVLIEDEPKFKLGEVIPAIPFQLSAAIIIKCDVVVRHITKAGHSLLGKYQVGLSSSIYCSISP